MNFDAQRLYELLPAFYRIQDAKLSQQLLHTEEEGPLKALLTILAEQIGVLEEDLAQLYDDQFIETCAEWVIPYIGDLVGARGLTVFPDATFSQRAQVANTLAYRRRKGTASVLEQLARDVTGWDASVVEYFQLLATTQYLNHRRPENLSIAPLNPSARLEYLNTPFDKIPRTVDVRSISRKRGKYNIPNVGIYLWRLDAHSVTDAPAYRVDDRRYTFDALGNDTPLYNRPKREDEITHLAEPINVPMPFSRQVLARDLQTNDLSTYYGIQDTSGNRQSILIRQNGVLTMPVPGNSTVSSLPERLADLVTICNLSDVTDASGTLMGWANMPQTKIALDPVLGRLAFPASKPPPTSVAVSYHFGFSANLGGGEYGRANTFSGDLFHIVRVPAEALTIEDALTLLLTKIAVAEAEGHSGDETRGGIIELVQNNYYFETPAITIPTGKKIELRAADERRPILVLNGDLTVVGQANAELVINGLLISGGGIHLPAQASAGLPNQLHTLLIRHCTLLPGPSPAIGPVAAQPNMPRLVVAAPDVEVQIEQSIVGSLCVTDQSTLQIRNSVIDATSPIEVAMTGLLEQEPGALLTIENSTVIGKVHTRLLKLASNTIFFASLAAADTWPTPVITDRLQEGCVRFSYLPPRAKVPRPYHCQPATPSDEWRVRPSFTSLRYGDPGYGQLSEHCADEIKQGADDGAEMGVFHQLYQPQREANLRARLDEYLPFGLEAGIYYGA